MFVFGGILEVTKELNDLISYDLKSETFSVIHPNGDFDSQYHSRFEDTPQNNHLSPHLGASPNRNARGNASPMKKHAASPSPVKKAATQQEKKLQASNKEESKGLSSPTSISMYNSFIIKNADQSFD